MYFCIVYSEMAKSAEIYCNEQYVLTMTFSCDFRDFKFNSIFVIIVIIIITLKINFAFCMYLCMVAFER